MPDNKIHIGIDNDLSFCSLSIAIKKFKEEFYFWPEWIEVGIENIFAAMDLRKMRKFKQYWFQCNKDFPENYWQVSKIIAEKKYVIYSNGA